MNSINSFYSYKIGSGKILEVKEICAKFTTDAIGTTAFGLKMNSLNDPDAPFRKLGKDIFTFDTLRAIELTSIFFIPHFAWLINSKFFREGSDFLRKSFWETMNERVKSGQKRNDLIDLLIEIKNSSGNNEVVNGLSECLIIKFKIKIIKNYLLNDF